MQQDQNEQEHCQSLPASDDRMGSLRTVLPKLNRTGEPHEPPQTMRRIYMESPRAHNENMIESKWEEQCESDRVALTNLEKSDFMAMALRPTAAKIQRQRHKRRHKPARKEATKNTAATSAKPATVAARQAAAFAKIQRQGHKRRHQLARKAAATKPATKSAKTAAVEAPKAEAPNTRCASMPRPPTIPIVPPVAICIVCSGALTYIDGHMKELLYRCNTCQMFTMKPPPM